MPTTATATERRQALLPLHTCGSAQSSGNWAAVDKAEPPRGKSPIANMIELSLRDSFIALLYSLY